MERVDGSDIGGMVEDMVYREKQVMEKSFILTIDRIERIDGRAELDFGGGEYIGSDSKNLEPVKRSEDDDYGWFELEKGFYVIHFNERLELEEGVMGILQPWERLEMSQASHGSRAVTGILDELKVVLKVGEEGIAFKENARVSELICFR